MLDVNVVNSGHHPGPVFAIQVAAGFGGTAWLFLLCVELIHFKYPRPLRASLGYFQWELNPSKPLVQIPESVNRLRYNLQLAAAPTRS